MVNGLGWRLENLRDQAGYSQKEISFKLGFSDNTYGQYEREERTPSIGTLIKLAKFYHVSLDYLLRGEEYKENEKYLVNDIAIKEVLDVFSKQRTDDSYTLSSNEEMYEEYKNNLLKVVAIKEILERFKENEINDPYILRSKQWGKLSREDLISLTKHFEWTVFQTNSDK